MGVVADTRSAGFAAELAFSSGAVGNTSPAPPVIGLSMCVCWSCVCAGATSEGEADCSGAPEELETGFQLAFLLLTEPKIERPSFTQFQIMTSQMLQESFRNPMMVGMRTTQAALYPDDEVRVHPITVEQLEKLSVDGAQAWLEKLIKESPIEVTIVGDVPREKVMDLVAKYIGALPSRPANV